MPISVNSRLAWCTQKVPEQPGVSRERPYHTHKRTASMSVISSHSAGSGSRHKSETLKSIYAFPVTAPCTLVWMSEWGFLDVV